MMRFLMKFWFRLLLVVLIIGAGVGAMIGFQKLRKDPQEREIQEMALEVTSMAMHPEDVPVVLTGFGTAHNKRKTDLSAEVSGRVLEVHPDLEVGEQVEAGAVLVQIDPSDYRLALKQAEADVERLRAEIAQLERTLADEKRTLELAQRTEELAERDYERVQSLATDAKVRSEAAVEAAEQAWNRARAELIAKETNIETLPIRIRSMEAQLARAEAAVATAQLHLERTTIKAPYSGRLTMRNVEVGQVVPAGKTVVSMVDDSVLAITVPLDADEAVEWLPCAEPQERPTWFGDLPDATAAVQWTQAPEPVVFTGRLARVEAFDTSSRTVKVVVEVHEEDNRNVPGVLTEGMFTEVKIPGRMAYDVFRVPREAVTHDGRILLDNDGRLATREAEIVHAMEEDVLVRTEIEPGSLLLLSRPTRVIDGIKVHSTIVNPTVAEGGSSL